MRRDFGSIISGASRGYDYEGPTVLLQRPKGLAPERRVQGVLQPQKQFGQKRRLKAACCNCEVILEAKEAHDGCFHLSISCLLTPLKHHCENRILVKCFQIVFQLVNMTQNLKTRVTILLKV